MASPPDDPFPPRPPLTPSQLHAGLTAALAAQSDGAAQDKRPFAAVLVGPDGTTVLARQFSLSHVEHAEATLCRAAAAQWTPGFLWRCTLYSTWEPCAMCAATLYWANVGALVYAAGERALRTLTGPANAENFTMDLPCRAVLAAGQKDVMVKGPFVGARRAEDGRGDGRGDDVAGGDDGVDWETRVCEAAWEQYWAEQRGLKHMSWSDVVRL